MKKLIVLFTVMLVCIISSAYALDRDAFLTAAFNEIDTTFRQAGNDPYPLAENVPYSEWFRDEYYKSGWNKIKGDLKGSTYMEDYPKNTEWCAIFVSWCANQAGISTDEIPFEANVNAMKQWYTNKNRFAEPYVYEPKPGDLIFFHNGEEYRHVGIVWNVDKTIKAPYTDRYKIHISTLEGDYFAGDGKSRVGTRDFYRDDGVWDYSEIAGFGIN